MPTTTSPLRARLQQLFDASLPFVTRTFRGNRLRRYGAASAMLAVLSVFIGVWLSVGRGEFERDMRYALDLENNHWDRDRISFTVTTFDAFTFDVQARDAEAIRALQTRNADNSLGGEIEQAYATLYTAQATQVPAEYADLHARAGALLERYPAQREDAQWYYGQEVRDWQFDWYAPAQRQRLQAIIDHDLVPQVVSYSSPLGTADAVRLVGAVAGGVVVVLMLVVAPLCAGATLAQEVHENTLQPVLGTRLRPVDIVTGLTASGMALAGLVAAPTLLVMVGTGLIAGNAAHLLPVLLLLPATSLALVLLTMLVGFGLGRRWSSGIVATVLTGGLCSLMMLGVGIGMNLQDEMVGLIAVVPPVGLVHGLRELFVPGRRLDPVDADYALAIMVLCVGAFSALAAVMSRALTRRVEGRTQASLTRAEGLIAAAVVTAMGIAVVPEFDANDAVPAYFVSLGLAAIPWQLILAGRVPVGDGPSRLRTLPLRSLMLELGAFAGVHALLLTLIFGPAAIPWTAVGAFHLLWALSVLGLTAVRTVAVPMNVMGSLWTMVCLGAVCFELVGAGIFAAAHSATMYSPSAPFPLMMFEVSAVLGVVQLVLTVLIPLSLVRILRKGSAALV